MAMIKLQLANNLAKHFHRGQKYGEWDYFEYHLRGVVDLLSEVSMLPVKEDMIVVAFLHDILEDTSCTYETLENIFGFTVADEVSVLTKVEGEPIEQYLFDVCSNHTARIVKFADSLFNYRECVKCGDLKRAKKYCNHCSISGIDNEYLVAFDPEIKNILQIKEKCLEREIREIKRENENSLKRLNEIHHSKELDYLKKITSFKNMSFWDRLKFLFLGSKFKSKKVGY